MERLKKQLERASIPAAFVICGLGCLAAAVLLTKATLYFAKTSLPEPRKSYEIGVVYAPEDSVAAVPGTWEEFEESGSDTVTLNPSVGVYTPAEDYAVTGGLEGAEHRVVFLSTQGVRVETVAARTGASPLRGLYDHMDELAAVLWYTVCLGAAAVIFYRWKIRRPYRALMEAVFKISDNDLNFEMGYQGTNELGRLCGAFELMRRELVRGKRRMWEAVEERKRLNSAFAHDMRTPLTVMRGHAEMIESELEGTADSESIRFSVGEISRQVDRLSAFADTVGRLRRLEDYEPRLSPVSAAELASALSGTARLLCPGVAAEVENLLGPAVLYTDAEALAQICENIISNASRHAKNSVRVVLRWQGDKCAAEVTDDGGGFSPRDLECASRAYYRGERRGDDAHFGLGLYISSVLAKKLGGELLLENSPQGGARVTATFLPSGAPGS